MAEPWVKTTLQDVAEVNPREPALPEDAPFITMADVDEWGTWAKPSGPRGTRGGAKARGGDVLVARITPCLENGKIAMVPADLGRVGGSTEFIVLRAGPRLLPEFLFLWAVSQPTHSAAIGLMVGTTGRQRVNGADIATLPISVPPLPVQRRIVDLMTHLDKHLANLRAEQNAAGAVADAVRADLFARGGTTVPLAEVVEVTNGRQRSPKNASGSYMTQYIRAANVKDGALVLDEPHLMNFDPAEQAKFGLSPGDVLVTEGCGSLSQIGASCQWNGEVTGTICFQNHLLRLRPRSADLSATMVYQWARHCFRSGQFAEIATGTSIFSLGATRVAKMPFPLDALRRQSLLEVASTLDSQVHGLASEAERLSEMRRTLLASLLEGGANIQDDYDSLLEAVA